MATVTETGLCPRYRHPYPEMRRRRSLNGQPRFYCRGCATDHAQHGAWEPDDGAVYRAVAGDPPRYLHPEERRRAVLILWDRGVSITESAVRARCTPRQVSRIRRQARGTDQ